MECKVQTKCSFCETGLTITEARSKASKHGKFFCNRMCKDKAQSLKGNCPEIRPPQYGLRNTKESIENRRKRNRGYGASRYAERRVLIDKIKMERGCTDCGYSSHPAALQFDHEDPNAKSFKIASCLMMQWEKIEAEIAKCVVRCANCHAVKTVTNEANRLRVGRPRAK